MMNQHYICRGKKPYQQYLFRCIIPQDLVERFSTREFRVSLRSSLYSQSKIISTNLYNLSQFIFREVREGKMKDITLGDVKDILRIEVRKSLLHIHHYELGTNVFSKDKLNESRSRVDKEEERLREKLEEDYKGTIDLIESEIDKILITQNLKPNNKNVEYKGLVRRWIELKLIRQDWKRDLLNETGKTDEDFRNEIEDKWKLGLFGEEYTKEGVVKSLEDYEEDTTPEVKSKSVSQFPLFSTLYPKHLQVMRDNRRRLDTIIEVDGTYKDFIEIIGDKPIDEYTNVDGRDYREKLSKLPKNRTKIKRYRDKTLKQILSMNVPVKDRMSLVTQKKLSSRMVTLWNFLIDEYPEYIGVNVFRKKSQSRSQIKLKDKKPHFTDDDIKIIFNHRTYLTYIFDNIYHKNNKLSYYFIPILGCLTGCRLEELCMMRVKDIIKVDGVWVYRIREEGEYGDEQTKVKNPYSERDIPLHSVLVDTLSFVKYVNHIKKLGEERVFYELPKISNRYQHYIGKFFNRRYLKKIGLKDDGRKVSYHSFRHSVETHLTNQNVNPRFIDYLQGHSSKDTGGNIYMKGIKPRVLKNECVEKIDWGIDWNKLKVDWKKII